MHKNTLILFLFSVLLMSCGARKSIFKSHKNSSNTEKSSTYKNQNTSSKKDSENFATFNIGSTEEYITIFKNIAIEEMEIYGIPASITLAQGILESGSGQSKLAKISNNHFGIKCHSDWNGSFVRYNDDAPKECFRKYKHPKNSFRDHSIFLATRPRYQFLFDYKKNNYKAWAKGLKKAGYATDRKYSIKLIEIIKKYQLYLFDRKAMQENSFSKKEKKTPVYVNHNVVAGETLYAISKKYGVSVDTIKEANKLDNNDIFIGQQLIIKTYKK